MHLYQQWLSLNDYWHPRIFNIRQNNTVILHAIDNGHSFVDSAKTIVSTQILHYTIYSYIISSLSFLTPEQLEYLYS